MAHITVTLVYSIHGTSRDREQRVRVATGQMQGVHIMAAGQDNTRDGEVWVGALYRGAWIH